MSQHEDVLSKMDALLNKHHDALARESVTEDFPVLTEMVEEAGGAIPLLTEVVEIVPDVVDFEAFKLEELPLPEVEELPLGGVELSLLDRQIREALEHQLPFHVIEAVDKALPIVLEALSRQLETMVRDAVAQALRQQQAKPQQQGGRNDGAE